MEKKNLLLDVVVLVWEALLVLDLGALDEVAKDDEVITSELDIPENEEEEDMVVLLVVTMGTMEVVVVVMVVVVGGADSIGAVDIFDGSVGGGLVEDAEDAKNEVVTAGEDTGTINVPVKVLDCYPTKARVELG